MISKDADLAVNACHHSSSELASVIADCGAGLIGHMLLVRIKSQEHRGSQNSQSRKRCSCNGVQDENMDNGHVCVSLCVCVFSHVCSHHLKAKGSCASIHAQTPCVLASRYGKFKRDIDQAR